MAAWRYDGAPGLHEAFQTRILIESKLCRLAAAVITPSTLEGPKAAALTFEDAWQSGDLVAHAEADLALHLGIAMACPTGC